MLEEIAWQNLKNCLKNGFIMVPNCAIQTFITHLGKYGTNSIPWCFVKERNISLSITERFRKVYGTGGNPTSNRPPVSIVLVHHGSSRWHVHPPSGAIWRIHFRTTRDRVSHHLLHKFSTLEREGQAFALIVLPCMRELDTLLPYHS